MYVIGNKLADTTLRAALLAALMLSGPVLAATDTGAATLAHNESAAQSAIVDTPAYDRFASSSPVAETTLAQNERASQRAIADTTEYGRTAQYQAASDAAGEATLAHNELAAQRVIADAPVQSRRAVAARSVSAIDRNTSVEQAGTR